MADAPALEDMARPAAIADRSAPTSMEVDNPTPSIVGSRCKVKWDDGHYGGVIQAEGRGGSFHDKLKIKYDDGEVIWEARATVNVL